MGKAPENLWYFRSIMGGHHGPHPPDEERSEPNEDIKSRLHVRHSEVSENGQNGRCDYRCEDGSLGLSSVFNGFNGASVVGKR